MPLVAEVVDAVVGGDTHRDTHALERLFLLQVAAGSATPT